MKFLLLSVSIFILSNAQAAGKSYECELRNGQDVLAEGNITLQSEDAPATGFTAEINNELTELTINNHLELETKTVDGNSRIWFPNRINKKLVTFVQVLGNHTLICYVPELD